MSLTTRDDDDLAVEGAQPARHDGTTAARPWKGAESSLVADRLAVLRAALLGADAVTLTLAFAIASLLRFGPGWTSDWALLTRDWFPLGALYGASVLLIFRTAGIYDLQAAWTLRSQVAALVRVVGLVAAATVAVLFFLNVDSLSRLFLIGFFALVLAGMVASRVLLRQWFRRLRTQATHLRHLLVVGSGATAEWFVTRLTATPELGVRVVGYASDDDRRVHEHPRLGSIEDVPALLTAHVVDEVAICLPLSQWRSIDRIVETAEEQGKAVRIPIDMLNRVISKGRVEQLNGQPVLSLSATPDDAPSQTLKRAVDLLVAAVGLVVLAPVLTAIALAVKLDDRGPVLFSQERVGLHGRLFRIRKFRTMVVDAEARLAALQAANERQGPAFKMTHDPRITRVGRLLRRTSLDELPQLWNVLVGQMSLVGPRPPLPGEVAQYDRWHRRRLSMKPGITGLWQVSARGEAEFDNWVALDLRYIDEWSTYNDLWILARTAKAVLKGTGA